jgi:hypothetical protein
MDERDRPAFASGLAALAANARAELDEIQIELLWTALRDELTLEQFKTATVRAMRELGFFPSVAELCRFAGVSRRSGVRIIDGKPHVWLGEGTGWGEWHGPLRELDGRPLLPSGKGPS